MTSGDLVSTPVRAWRPSPGRWLILATLVLLTAAAFRLIALDSVPPGLAQDEILDADIALFIRGGENALFFRHGYGHEPLYHYWAAPFQSLLGDNILSIRLPAVFLGLLLVALTLRWAKRDYGTAAALVAGFGLAVSWWPIIFSRIGIRPILEPVLLVSAMWFWPLRVVDLTRRRLVSAALAGLLLGLAIYSYTAARIILLVPALMLAVLAGQYLLAQYRGSVRRNLPVLRAQISYAAVVLAVGMAVYLPLALTLRANPQLQQRLEQLEGPLEALREGNVEPVFRMTAATLGVFSFTGDPRWTYSLPDRPLFDPMTALLFYFGFLVSLWRWRRPIYSLLFIWLFVAILPSALSPDAPSTVRLVGALPVVYLLPGLAVQELFNRLGRYKNLSLRARRTTTALLAAGLSVLIVVNGYRTVRDGFIRWPNALETRLRYQAVLSDIARYLQVRQEDATPVVADSFFEPIDQDSLRRAIGKEPAARWVQTGGGVSGAVVWPAGQTLTRLYVPEYAPLDVELAEAAGIDEQPLYRSGQSPSFAVYPLPEAPAISLQVIEADFGKGSAISLLGYAMLNGCPSVENEIRLVTWWRVGEELPSDLAVFIHVLDESGTIVAQYDGLDAAALTLHPGDKVLQRHVIPLPSDQSGSFDIVIGLYTRGDGQRLLTPAGADSVELTSCE